VIDAIGAQERFARARAQREIGEGIEFQRRIMAALDQTNQIIVATRLRCVGLPKIEDIDLRFLASPVAEGQHLACYRSVLCFQERDIATGTLRLLGEWMQPEIPLKPFAVGSRDQTGPKRKQECDHQPWCPRRQSVERQAGRKRECNRGLEPHIQVDTRATAETCPDDHSHKCIERAKRDVSFAAPEPKQNG